jgi:large subunit ribosomal protein L3
LALGTVIKTECSVIVFYNLFHSLRKHMKFILGEKQNMVQFFNDKGESFPATLLLIPPVVITEVKTKDTHGYQAVQIGIPAKEKKLSKSEKGNLKDLGIFKPLKEFRVRKGNMPAVKRGETIDVSSFKEGDVVTISGVSKGKGFQGVVKRHGFAGGPRTHGQKHSEREAGGIGGGGRAGGRVAKGLRMAGRMGGDRVSVKNLKVLLVDKNQNAMLVSGAIPGRRGTLVEIVSNE